MKKYFLLIAFSVIFTGCSTTKKTERGKFSDSLGMLYSITKVGEGISLLGEGFQKISQPKDWGKTRQKNTIAVANEEQDKYIRTISNKT